MAILGVLNNCLRLLVIALGAPTVYFGQAYPAAIIFTGFLIQTAKRHSIAVSAKIWWIAILSYALAEVVMVFHLAVYIFATYFGVHTIMSLLVLRIYLLQFSQTVFWMFGIPGSFQVILPPQGPQLIFDTTTFTMGSLVSIVGSLTMMKLGKNRAWSNALIPLSICVLLIWIHYTTAYLPDLNRFPVDNFLCGALLFVSALNVRRLSYREPTTASAQACEKDSG
jgi:uncharacterized membrane protein